MPGKEYMVYRCTLPDCNHYTKPELLVGKRANCNRCGKDFIITAELARLAKIHCKACTVKEEKPDRIKLPEDFELPNFPGSN